MDEELLTVLSTWTSCKKPTAPWESAPAIRRKAPKNQPLPSALVVPKLWGHVMAARVALVQDQTRQTVGPKCAGINMLQMIGEGLDVLLAEADIMENHKIKENLKVAIRIKPCFGLRKAIRGVADKVLVAGATPSMRRHIQYSQVFPEHVGQQEVYDQLDLDQVVDNALVGIDACLFAYGQTGSGKTYTMMGMLGDCCRDNIVDSLMDLLPLDTINVIMEFHGKIPKFAFSGIVPRLCGNLMSQIIFYCVDVTVEYVEIYNEKVTTLVDKVAVRNAGAMFEVIHQGNRKRTTRATMMNDYSSRSHAIFSITVTHRKYTTTYTSTINLVDLAGSERVGQNARTTQEHQEGCSINKSLLALERVCLALAKNHKFVPYRDSVLTSYLEGNLGKNGVNYLIATVSPLQKHFTQSLGTLNYAATCGNICIQLKTNMSSLVVEVKRVYKALVLRNSKLEELGYLDYFGAPAEAQKQMHVLLGEVKRLFNQLRDIEGKLVQLLNAKGKGGTAKASKARENARRLTDLIRYLVDELFHIKIVPPSIQSHQQKMVVGSTPQNNAR